MPRRHNAVALARSFKDLINAGIVKEKPAWLPAMELFPPGPAPTRSITPGMVFRPQPLQQTTNQKSIFPSRNASRRLGGKLLVREAQQSVPRIEYPEDDLRRRFYDEHPFELMTRPSTMVEQEAELRKRVLRKWDSVENGELNAEAVIKHALYLKSAGMDLKEAYIQSVKVFRLARGKEEQEQLNRRRENWQDSRTPASDRFRKLESANLSAASQASVARQQQQGQQGRQARKY